MKLSTRNPQNVDNAVEIMEKTGFDACGQDVKTMWGMWKCKKTAFI